MKVSTSELKKAMCVADVTNGRSTMPILDYVLLRTRKNELQVTATDLSTTMIYDIECEGDIEVLVDAKKLKSIVSTITGEIIEIIDNGDTVKISDCNILFELPTGKLDLFPIIPEMTNRNAISIPSEMIHNTMFACSKEQARAIFTGMLIQSKDGKLYTVATDGKMISENWTEYSEDVNAVLPFNALNIASKHFKGDEVRLYIDEHICAICDNYLTVVTKTLDGIYPNYTKVFPTELSNKLVIDRNALLLAIRQASVTVSLDSNKIVFKLSSFGCVLESICDEGKTTIPLDCEYDGAEYSAGVNYKLLQQVVSSVGDRVEMCFNDRKSPIIITTENGRRLLMPMRL